MDRDGRDQVDVRMPPASMDNGESPEREHHVTNVSATAELPRRKIIGGTRRRRWPVIVAVGVLVLIAVAIVAWPDSRRAPAQDHAAPATTTVVRENLVDVVTARGELAYGPERLAENRLHGTVTAVTGIGATVKRGQELFRVDDKPVVLLYGTLPAYRTLTAGGAGATTSGPGEDGHGTAARSDATGSAGGTNGAGGTSGSSGAAAKASKGRDVRQFEMNLRALGYRGFNVDENYDEQTAAAVRRWQKSLGLEQTGVVDIGRVFYATGPIRVAAQKIVVGQVANGPVIAFTGTTRLVTVGLSTSERSVAKVKAKVTIELRNGKRVRGTVRSVRDPKDAPEASSDGVSSDDQVGVTDQQNMIKVDVALDDSAAINGRDTGPASVDFVAEEHKDVLVVPVGALLALAEGGYGLQLIEKGTVRVVAVTTGLFADGKVEVSGAEVREGMTVGMAQ
jgi:peptidoglycan hydrolase-like protein with peptidoglycan-binding domain